MQKCWFILCILFLVYSSCTKDRFFTAAYNPLVASTDTLMFDTVFTEIGSVTRNFRIKNTSGLRVKIQSIQLAGGMQTPYIINVDGVSGSSFKDIELDPDDSLYVFVQIKINPNDANSPYIISDKLQFTVNSKITEVILEAWGQNAYYHRPNHAIKFKDGSYLPYSIISEQLHAVEKNGLQFTLKTDKPHVVYGYLVVDSTQQLIIPADVKLYMNYKSGLWVYRYGSLKVLGEFNRPVIIQGARRDRDYIGTTGQWDRIWINEGRNDNYIRYAVIKDGFIGVQADVFGTTLDGSGKLKIENTIIQNMSKYGIQALGYTIDAYNLLVTNCQEHLLNIDLNGTYTFLHSTFVNYWDATGREKSALRWNNYIDDNKQKAVFPLNLYFGNCIVDGKKNEELQADIQTDPTLNVQFNNCWLKATEVNQSTLINCVNSNVSLEYKDPQHYLFKLKSPQAQIMHFTNAQAQADASKVPFDIEQIKRNTQDVTIGVFENP